MYSPINTTNVLIKQNLEAKEHNIKTTTQIAAKYVKLAVLRDS